MNNVLAVLFKNESEGFQAMTELRQNAVTEEYAVLQMALVKREGKDFVVKDTFGSGIKTGEGMAVGGLLGAFLGILGGPLGVLLMGSYGAMVGGIAGSVENVDNAAMIEAVAEKLQDGEAALIAVAEEKEEAILDAEFGKYETTIMRFDAGVVAQEVEEAEKIQKEMEKQARRELRAVRNEEFKSKIQESQKMLEEEFEILRKNHL